MQISGVILAGGQSQRMGRDKVWIEFGGKSLAQLALDKLRALGAEEVFVSGRQGHDYSSLRCRVLTDIEPGLGPIAGIERALNESSSPLVAVLPVDLPRMSLEFLHALLRRCDPVTGAVARLQGQIEPLVAIYPKRCHTIALFNMAKGQYSVRAFAEACLKERALRTVPVTPAHAACFINCNTPADLADLAGESPRPVKQE